MNIGVSVILFLLFCVTTYIVVKNNKSTSVKMIWLSSFFLLLGYVTDMWGLGLIALYFSIYSLVSWSKGV